MSETPDIAVESGNATEQSVVHHHHTSHPSSRLYRALAWVGIVAGVVFTVAVIFISGLILGRSSGGYHGWNRGYHSGQMGPGGSMGDCPMMRKGGMMGPGGMGPGPMMEPGEVPPSPPAKPSAPPRP